MKEITRREVLKILGAGVAGITAASMLPEHLRSAEAAEGLPPFEKGKYQTFPRFVSQTYYSNRARRMRTETLHLQYIDIGTLGPDVDVIVGVDFPGNIPTEALEIYRPPANQQIEETRVVFIKRAPSEDGSGTGLETVQLHAALGGDRFDIQKISDYGGDEALDAMARFHAQNTARRHQKVIYLGDLGAFENQWGQGERELLTGIIRAQRPGRPDLGIPESNFAYPREY